MTNTEFVTRITEKNTTISFKDLLEASLKFPIISLRDMNNLDLVLTDSKVSEIDNAEDLIFYIEKHSRKLDVKLAKSRRLKKEKQIINLIDSYKQRFIEELKLSELSSEALGYEFKEDNACLACGYNATSNGICNC